MVKCLYCGNEIPLSKNWKRKKYCNRICKGGYLGRIRYEKLSENSKCIDCGASIGYKYKRCIRCSRRGSLSSIWAGNNVKYRSLHAWVKRNKDKVSSCEKCGSMVKSLDLANISGEYKRDINDFKWLCRKCHMKEDGRLDKFRDLHKNLKRGAYGN